MRTIDCSKEDWRAILAIRGQENDPELESQVSKIIADVRVRGDEALLEFARRFDSPNLTTIKTDLDEIEHAEIGHERAEALSIAFARICEFHDRQIATVTSAMKKSKSGWSWQMPNSSVGQRLLPLTSAGLYVPGGRASYPSSVLMLSAPAQSAGVKQVVMATPAMSDQTLPIGVLAALKISKVKSVFKIGGASAVAALTFGTESVPRVDKIFGPGNKFVNEAKRQLWGSVGVDGQYGPSEVCVVIDRTSNAKFAVADLLTQIEHAPDNLGFLVSLGPEPLSDIDREVEEQLAVAPRADILRSCLENSFTFVCSSLGQAADVVNLIAPEHLTISTADPEALCCEVQNAGCVLLGEWTPESASDYCLGPCHALPTNAAARFASPLNAMDFLKFQSVSKLTREELIPLIDVVDSIAATEGFPAHAVGATIRRAD